MIFTPEDKQLFYNREDYENGRQASYVVGLVSGALIASGLWVLALISLGYFISH